MRKQVAKWGEADTKLINNLKTKLLTKEKATAFCAECDDPAAPDDYLCWEHRAKALMGREENEKA